MRSIPLTRRFPAALFATSLALSACLTVLVLPGCSTDTTKVATVPKDFEQTELLTTAIATEVLAQADILLNAGKIKPADARNLVKQTDEVKAGVQIAKALVPTQPSTAQQRIDASLASLQALRDYLVKRGASFTPAAAG